jgi:hypothetical protein
VTVEGLDEAVEHEQRDDGRDHRSCRQHHGGEGHEAHATVLVQLLHHLEMVLSKEKVNIEQIMHHYNSVS